MVVPGPPTSADFARRVRAARTTRNERAAAGKAVRKVLPLADHRQLNTGPRPDPVALLETQAAQRVPQLIPIRYGRMLATPFTFFRGGALIMAADLGSVPHTGLPVQLCGDAHLSNFGFYSTPERNQAFDINDFDETYPGPFEWDVKRLAASVVVASLTSGFTRKKARSAAVDTVRGYREEVRRLGPMGNLDVWYSHQDMSGLLRDIRHQVGAAAEKSLSAGLTKARFRDSNDALRKLCITVDGQVQIKNDPPLIVPGEELLAGWGEDVDLWYAQIETMIAAYREGLQSDRRHLFDQFRFVQLGFKMVGVGSVGTRAYVLLMDGASAADPLVLQAKEAQRSVLADYLGPVSAAVGSSAAGSVMAGPATVSSSAVGSSAASSVMAGPATPEPPAQNEGERVVRGQRLIQMTSDIFLGWQRVTGVDGQQRDFYIRQLRDGKGSVVVEDLDPAGMAFYGRLCGKTLARAHARTGDRVAIAAYLGGSDTFDTAVADYAMAYAERNDADYAALQHAAAAGRIVAREGI